MATLHDSLSYRAITHSTLGYNALEYKKPTHQFVTKLANPINPLPKQTTIIMQDTHSLVVCHTPSWLTQSI